MVSSCMSTYMINIIDKIGMSQSLLGVCLFMMAASELPMMMMAPRLKSRFGLMPVLLIAALAYGVRNICIATADSMMMLIIGLIFQGMSYGVFTALITDYAGSALAAEDRMLGQSWIAISTTGIGGTIGNLLEECCRMYSIIGTFKIMHCYNCDRNHDCCFWNFKGFFLQRRFDSLVKKEKILLSGKSAFIDWLMDRHFLD